MFRPYRTRIMDSSMPSFADSAVIILLGLLLFGPKGLAQIARQLGKLMGEFRRASNEFRMQMEEELRIAEQADRQKQIAAIEAAAPVTPALSMAAENGTDDHPQLQSPTADAIAEPTAEVASESAAESSPLPIASSGELKIMPPATGLPAPRSSSLAALIDAVPRVEPDSAASNGHAAGHSNGHAAFASEPAHPIAAEEPIGDSVGESIHG